MAEPFVNDPDFTLHVGDALETLQAMPAESVHCCVTSPPYWGLRDYGTGTWDGGDADCDHRIGRTMGNENKGAYREVLDGDRERCKCGATRVDQQLGLEPTPDEYVTNMVNVFREVRRVLRADGTLWLNIGDSYASQGGERTYGSHDGATGRGDAPGPRISVNGLKPKDLVGIPWRLAFALQQPWERHVIAQDVDRAWMAGLIDGEGCVSVVAVQPTTGVNESHSMRLQVRMADAEAVERVVAITGMSNVTYDLDTGQGNRPAQQWKISGDKAADALADIYPFLTVKRRQAIIGWNLQRLKDGIVTGRGQPIPAENMAKRRLLHDVLRKLNQREPVDIPSWCREPTVETEPGWYLRSDVIWSKPNPMPESVTDRPTKAHEYLFLLTKSPRYFYDADAIREPHSPDGRLKTVHDHATPNSHPNYDSVGNGNERWPNSGRNKRSVWEIATEAYPDAHFATFPQALVEPCIKAGTSEHGCCPVCGAPWERVLDAPAAPHDQSPAPGSIKARLKPQYGADRRGGGTSMSNTKSLRISGGGRTTGWRPSCDCSTFVEDELGGEFMHPGFRPAVVLDPFLGSGTTAQVARRLGRRSIGIELNREYAQLAARRLQQQSLFA